MNTRILRSSCLGLIVAGALAVGGCKREEAVAATKGPEAVPVVVKPVAVQSVQRSVDVVGTLWGTEDATISAKVAGRIVAIKRDMGDRAKAGEALAQVDKTDYELTLIQRELAEREALAKLGLDKLPEGEFDAAAVPTVQQARLRAANEQAKFNRGKQLHDQQPPLISDQDFADLQTAWEVSKADYEVALLTARSQLNLARSLHAQVEIAQQALRDTTIVAPAPTGTDAANTDHTYAVSARMVSVGEYVREGTALFRLVDDDPVKLRAAVPERFVADVKVGQRVRVKVESYEEEFEGQVTRVNPQIDPTNRAFQIEAIVPNEKRMLKPGAFARAAIETRTDDNVVFVPQNALVQFAGVNKVFSVDTNNKAVEHTIQVGTTRGEMVEVVKGLEPNTSVVTEGATKLATGVPVKVRT